MVRLFALLLVLMMPVIAIASGPPNYLPDGEHPRIWINSEMRAQLATKLANGDQNWVNLVAWCDAHINDAPPTTKDYSWGDAGNGYRGSGYYTRLVNYALAYQVLKPSNPTKANQYADYAVSLMNTMVSVFSAGEELDGISMIRMGASTDITINAAEAADNGTVYQGTKNGYTARNFGFAFPLAYDWLYDRISVSDKLKFVRVMYRWMDWCRGVRSTYNNGVLINGVRYYEDKNGDCTGANNCTTASGTALKAYQSEQAGVNFQTDIAVMDALISVATYGDMPDSSTYLSKFKTERWDTQIKPYLDNPLYFKGGDSPEGMSYFSSWNSLVKGMYAYSESTGDNLFTGLDWPKDMLMSYMGQTASDLTDVVREGDWPGNVIGKPFEKFVLAPAYIIRREYPADATGSIAQGYLYATTFGLPETDAHKLLWSEPAETQPVSSLPLSHVAIGTGLTAMRSTWSNQPDTNFASIQLGQGWRMSHQSYNQGNLLLQRGSDRLLVRNEAVTTTTGHNTIVFNNSQQYAMNPVPSSPPISAYDERGTAFYIKGDITNAHKRQYNADLCKLFVREMFFVRPNYYVVKDTTQSNTATGLVKDWYTQYISDPAISGNTITATVGGSKAFISTLTPIGSFTKTNPSTGFYRVKFTPTTAQEYDQFLHVIEATGSASAQTTTIPISGTGGTGALIADPAENKVVMFTSDQSGANITSLSYSVDTSAASRHYIADLVPNTNYAVTIDGGAAVTYTASSAGVIEFVNPVHSPHTYTVTQTGTPPVTPTTTRVFNGRFVGSWH